MQEWAEAKLCGLFKFQPGAVTVKNNLILTMWVIPSNFIIAFRIEF
jgi:hypothetical protein